jgi:hypothetical protein
MTAAMKSTNRGQSNTLAPMIDHCAQIETLPIARDPRRTHKTSWFDPMELVTAKRLLRPLVAQVI